MLMFSRLVARLALAGLLLLAAVSLRYAYVEAGVLTASTDMLAPSSQAASARCDQRRRPRRMVVPSRASRRIEEREERGTSTRVTALDSNASALVYNRGRVCVRCEPGRRANVRCIAAAPQYLARNDARASGAA